MTAAPFPLPDSDAELPISPEALELPLPESGASKIDDSWQMVCTLGDPESKKWVATTLSQLNIPSVFQPEEFNAASGESPRHPATPRTWQVMVPKQFAQLAKDALQQLLGSTESD